MKKNIYVILLFILVLFVVMMVYTGNTKPIAEIKKGDFIYRLVSEKAFYKKGEPIRMYEELEYVGDKEEITIGHALSPFTHNLHEKTRDYKFTTGTGMALGYTTLSKGEPLRRVARVGGGHSSDASEEYKEFALGIMMNEYPIGDYEITGIVEFFVCSAECMEEPDEYSKNEIRLEGPIKFKVR